MKQSTYDSCLLIKSSLFEIVDLQTNDTLILEAFEFANAEEKAIKIAKFLIKEREHLTANKSIKFNEALIQLTFIDDLLLNQKAQIAEISLINIAQKSSSISAKDIVRSKLTSKEQYVAQRARDAYVTSICQFEASFDLSNAAQAINSTNDDIKSLNKRLQ